MALPYASPDWAKSIIVQSTHHERRPQQLLNDSARTLTHDHLHLQESFATSFACDLNDSFACDEVDSKVGASVGGPSDSVSDMSSWAGASQLKAAKKSAPPTAPTSTLTPESQGGGATLRLSRSTSMGAPPKDRRAALGIAQRLVGDLVGLCQDIGETTHHHQNNAHTMATNASTSNHNPNAPPKTLSCTDGEHSMSAITTPSLLQDSPLHSIHPNTDMTVSSYGSLDDSNPQFHSRFSRRRSSRYQKLAVQTEEENNNSTNNTREAPKERKVGRTFSLPARRNSKVACVETPKTADSNSTRQRQAFPLTLYDMIERCDPSIASWADDGNSFVVHSVDQFEKEVLPQFFQNTKFGAFLKMLSFFSFRKTRPDPKNKNHIVFEHKDFRRGRPQLLGLIRRRNSTNNSNTGSNTHVSNTFREEDDSLMQSIPGSGSFSLSRRDSLRDQVEDQGDHTYTTHHWSGLDSVHSTQTTTEVSTTVSEACARTHRETTLKKWKKAAQRQLAVLPTNYPRCEQRDAVSKDALTDLLDKLYNYFQRQDVDAKHDSKLATFGLVLCTKQQCELNLLVWYTDESKSSLFVEVDMIKHKSGGGCQGSFPIEDVHRILRTVKAKSSSSKSSNHRRPSKKANPAVDANTDEGRVPGTRKDKDEMYSPKSPKRLSLPKPQSAKTRAAPLRRSVPDRTRTMGAEVSKLRRSLPMAPTNLDSLKGPVSSSASKRSVPGRVKSYHAPRLSQILDVRYRKL